MVFLMIPISSVVPIAASSFISLCSSHNAFFGVLQQCRRRGNNIHTLNDVISSTSLHSSNDNNGYRPIGEVVGGLHGGKYQFDDYSGFGQSTFLTENGSSRSSSYPSQEDKEPKEIPNWAQLMQPLDNNLLEREIISIPSNSNPMDGMIYSASIVIQNQERTWEEFYVKIMRRRGNGEFVQIESRLRNEDLIVKPRSGSLAPRGGSSNVCDAGKPYSDSVQIKLINSHSNVVIRESDELWLVVGTEEEKWNYQLKLEK